ncbi:DUF2357 domain-containing protein [bacterium]|nr:DUF2357 domain-containing protein [bacterium]
MAVEELTTIYRKIAEGNGKEYELLFALQGIFLAVTEFDPVTDKPLHSTVDDVLHTLASFDIGQNGWHNDRLHHIVGFVSSAIHSLIEILHEKNLREHRITRPEQVHEVDSRCMMWLAKKPGFTIKQKIASEQRMMGVYHTTSLDTAENRLFKAFMQNLDELLSEKENAAVKCGKPLDDDSGRFVATVHNWLKSEECSIIGRWNNTPPNNTLLNDKNYRKIWKGHLMLQNLSGQIQHDLKHIDELKNHAFFWLSAAKMNRNNAVRFKQGVLFPDYKNLSFSNKRELTGFAKSARIGFWYDFSIVGESDGITLSLGDNNSSFSVKDKENIGDIYSLAEQVCSQPGVQLKNDFKILSDKETEEKIPVHPVAAVDLNSVLPNFASGDGTKVTGTGIFTKKLLHQSHCNEGEWYPCSAARSKLIDSIPDNIKTFSIHSVFNRNLHAESDKAENRILIEKACADFAKTIKEELHCRKCFYITSDDVDDFSPSVKAFKHSMNAAFQKTEIMPRSIAALFMRLPEIQSSFSDGDEFAVCADYNDYKIETKIRIVVNDELAQKNPETKGIQFKRIGYSKVIRNPLQLMKLKRRRNPSMSKLPEKLKNVISLFVDEERLKDRFSADNYHFEDFLGGFDGGVPITEKFIIFQDENASSGALEYDRLQQITPDIPLWLDCLPRLSMIDSKRKEYVLVDPEKVAVCPAFGRTTEIPISWTFSFPVGKSFYEFPLIQGEESDGGKNPGDGEYFAYIKDSAFPLADETECRLHLTYTYGMPTPYHLEFIPLVPESAKFKSVSVKWENETHRDFVHDMPVPNFVREYTWDDMRRVPKEKEDRFGLRHSDIIWDWLPKEYKNFSNLAVWGDRWPGYNWYNPQKSLRFPALTAWNNGRSIYDDDCPRYFRELTLRAVEDLKTILEKNLYYEDTHFKFFLSCMHKDTPEWFSNELLEVVDRISWDVDYPSWIAYSLGDCSQEWQRELLSKTLDMFYSRDSEYAIRILAKALWRVNDFVFNLTAEDAGKILNAINRKLPVLRFDCYKNYDNWQNLKKFSACLECIVALCRLRETKDKGTVDEKMLEILSPSKNSDVKQILENLEYRKRNPVKIPTFLSFNIDRQGDNDNSPDLLYAAYGYLSGHIENNAITVLEAKFTEKS